MTLPEVGDIVRWNGTTGIGIITKRGDCLDAKTFQVFWFDNSDLVDGYTKDDLSATKIEIVNE